MVFLCIGKISSTYLHYNECNALAHNVMIKGLYHVSLDVLYYLMNLLVLGLSHFI